MRAREGKKNNHTNHLRIGFLFSRSHSAKSVEHIEKLLYSLKLEQIALTVYPCLSRQPTSRSYQWKNPSSNSPIFVYSLNRKCKYSFSIYSVKRMRSHIWSQWSIPAHFSQWCTLHNAMQEQCWIGWLCHSTLSFSHKKKTNKKHQMHANAPNIRNICVSIEYWNRLFLLAAAFVFSVSFVALYLCIVTMAGHFTLVWNQRVSRNADRWNWT